MDFLRAPTATARHAAGHVFVMRCEPDPFTGERVNIGVCVCDASGKRLVRAIDEPGRLKCFYGESAHAVVRLAQVAAEAAQHGQPSPSPQITFDPPTPFYNVEAERMLALAFSEQVTCAIPTRNPNDSTRLPDAQALELVSEQLRERMNFVGELLASPATAMVQTPRGALPVTVHLQPRNGVGVIRSVDYNTDTLKAHLIDSVLDLQCAAHYRQRRQQALFILRPENEPEHLAGARDAVINRLIYRAPDLQVEQADNAPALADYIMDWAATAA